MLVRIDFLRGSNSDWLEFISIHSTPTTSPGTTATNDNPSATMTSTRTDSANPTSTQDDDSSSESFMAAAGQLGQSISVVVAALLLASF